MTDCIFCKIANGEIPSELVYEDDRVVAFNDLNPQAAHHVLIIPTQHIETLNDLDESHAELAGQMVLAAARIAKARGFAEQGYRTVLNCNQDGGQSVYHIHLHLLGGRRLTWPPG